MTKGRITLMVCVILSEWRLALLRRSVMLEYLPWPKVAQRHDSMFWQYP